MNAAGKDMLEQPLQPGVVQFIVAFERSDQRRDNAVEFRFTGIVSLGHEQDVSALRQRLQKQIESGRGPSGRAPPHSRTPARFSSAHRAAEEKRWPLSPALS